MSGVDSKLTTPLAWGTHPNRETILHKISSEIEQHDADSVPSVNINLIACGDFSTLDDWERFSLGYKTESDPLVAVEEFFCDTLSANNIKKVKKKNNNLDNTDLTFII